MPPSVNRSNAKHYDKSPAVTDFHEFEGRDHWTCAAPGWEAVADHALAWAREHSRTASTEGGDAARTRVARVSMKLEGALALRDNQPVGGYCPIERTMAVVSTRSAMLVLREAFYGASRFEEFAARADLTDGRRLPGSATWSRPGSSRSGPTRSPASAGGTSTP